jgi:putative membrane protein
MRYYFLIFILASVVAHAQTSPGSAPAQNTDRTFLRQAAEGNMAEVHLGQLAQKSGSSDVVKRFGTRMVTDHSSMEQHIRQVATAKGISLAAALSSKDQATYQSLSAKTGGAFDRAYITGMIHDHVHDISAFEQEANSGTDPDIRALASKALPTLQEHLRLAEDAARQLGIPTNPSGPEQ